MKLIVFGDEDINEPRLHLQTEDDNIGRQGWASDNLGVGKSTIIQTFLQGAIPKTLPPNEDIGIYIKKEDYTRNNPRKIERVASEEKLDID